MIRKLRLRFILAALVSILFVLAATIAAINSFNYIKIDNETAQSLDAVINYGHEGVYSEYHVLTEEQKLWIEEQQQRWIEEEQQQQPFIPPGQFWQPSDFFYQRREEINEQFFVTAFDEDGGVAWKDYRYYAIGDDDEEILQLMSTKALKSGLGSGNIGKLRFKVFEIQESKDAVTDFDMEAGRPVIETIDLNYTYVAFLDTSERNHALGNFFTSSMIIAAISYTVLAILIILSSKLVFKTTEESYKKQKAFITNASHELKTPLTIISTDLELVEMDHGKSEWTESIHDQVIRLNAMTKQLVTLSKLDEGNSTNYPFSEFSLSKLAEESVDSFTPTFKSKKITLNSDIASDINMRGNVYLINELFYIFFDNALKYTKNNGEVNLRVKKNSNRKNEIVFFNDIEDNEIDTNLLFERFYRSPNSVTKEGSGIGLSIAKEIVELHKGKISVSIKENKIYFIIIL